MCKSETATLIAETLCFGQNSCVIKVSKDQNTTWIVQDSIDKCGRGAEVVDRTPTGLLACVASLGGGKSNFKGCTSTKRLAVVGKCYRDEVSDGCVRASTTLICFLRRSLSEARS